MPPRHTPQDIESALTAYAIAGNSLKASEMSGYSDRTIRKWCERYPEKLARIEAQRAPLIDALLVDQYRRTGLHALEVTGKALRKTEEALEAGTLKDPSAAAKNAATVSGIFTDKVAVMEGRPTSIIEHRSSDDVLRDLERGGFIDSTAHSIEDQDPTSSLMPARASANARELPESTG
jgi:hypothetical protein